MPICPICGTKYPVQIGYCETCRTSLVDSPEDTAEEGIESIELAELATFSNVSEAEMIKEILEKNEIRTVQRGEVDPIGVASGAEPITLFVEESNLSRAREIYEAYFAGSADEKFLSDQE